MSTAWHDGRSAACSRRARSVNGMGHCRLFGTRFLREASLTVTAPSHPDHFSRCIDGDPDPRANGMQRGPCAATVRIGAAVDRHRRLRGRERRRSILTPRADQL